jgi:hypothetical protein
MPPLGTLLDELSDELKGLFDKEKCERAINYDRRTLKIKAKAEVPGITFSLDDFKTEVSLDDYQYQMCKICERLGKNDPE